MIPFIARVSLRHKRRNFRFWIPLALVWLLLLPVVLMLMPFFVIACIAGKVSPLVALSVCWDIVVNTKGSEIEVDNAGTSLAIYVF